MELDRYIFACTSKASKHTHDAWMGMKQNLLYFFCCLCEIRGYFEVLYSLVRGFFRKDISLYDMAGHTYSEIYWENLLNVYLMGGTF